VGQAIIVIDVGKTSSKVSLIDGDGHEIARHVRSNAMCRAGGLARLDALGIEQWLRTTLAGLPCRADVAWIVPVGHGAAAAFVGPAGLLMPPLDYEQPIPNDVAKAYDGQRDDFALTGSPRLAHGLNLGAQLDFLETREPELFAGDATLLPWPQYWAYLLSGVLATEVSSLGCHSDLWHPLTGRPSDLSIKRGWANRFAPLRPASAVLGRLSNDWADATGLSSDVKVLCGLHDSNAALLAALGHSQAPDQETNVLSTGTWFVVMRSLYAHAEITAIDLPAARDCLVNVDVDGRATPSARFMGGRELQLLGEDDGIAIDDPRLQQQLLDAATAVVADGAMILPSAVASSGPYPDRRMTWIKRPGEPIARGAAAALYAALVVDVMLDLTGSRERLIVEGRFSQSRLMVGALAAMRPNMDIFIAPEGLDLAFGACRLVHPDMDPPTALERVKPLPLDMQEYHQLWRSLAERQEATT
jgi:sugar (pentulose or hexulose) kinase